MYLMLSIMQNSADAPGASEEAGSLTGAKLVEMLEEVVCLHASIMYTNGCVLGSICL